MEKNLFIFFMLVSIIMFLPLLSNSNGNSSLVLHIFTDSKEYQLGSEVYVGVYLYNNSTSSINLTLDSGTLFWIRISDTQGNYIYSRNITRGVEFRSISLKPFAVLNDSLTWIANKPGNYLVFAQLSGHPEINSTTSFVVYPYSLYLTMDKTYYQLGDSVSVDVYVYGEEIGTKGNVSINTTLIGALSNFRYSKIENIQINQSYYKNVFEYKFQNLKPDYYRLKSILLFESGNISSEIKFMVYNSTQEKLSRLTLNIISEAENPLQYGYLYLVLNENFNVLDLFSLQFLSNTTNYYWMLSGYRPSISISVQNGKYSILVLAFSSDVDIKYLSSYNLLKLINVDIKPLYVGYKEVIINNDYTISLKMESINKFYNNTYKSLFISTSSNRPYNNTTTILFFDLFHWLSYQIDSNEISLTFQNLPALVIAYVSTGGENPKILAIGTKFVAANLTNVNINLQEIFMEMPEDILPHPAAKLSTFTFTTIQYPSTYTSYMYTSSIIPTSGTPVLANVSISSRDIYLLLTSILIAITFAVIVSLILNKRI